MEPKDGGSIPSAGRDPGSRKARPKVRDGEGTLAAAPAWVPYSQRAIDHQRHSRDGLMSHVANVINEQLNSLDAQRLPELVKPDGAGYMPLYCVAQWIVTHGGTRVINRFDEVLWREAYKVLLDRIASEDVKVLGLGVRDGATETVSGIHFASCSVAYPFSDTPLDLILSKELCLFSRPYLDDEHWRRGFDDSLEDRRGARWRRLMVLKADVARYWPFAAALDHGPPTHTPAARPTKPAGRRGTPPKADWSAIEEAFRHEVADRGIPDETNVDGWQWQADVQRWLSNILIRERVKSVSKSTLRRRAKDFLSRAREGS
jgi:hypothetical protein